MASQPDERLCGQKAEQPRHHDICLICTDVAETDHTLFYREGDSVTENCSVALCQLCYQDYLAGRLKIDYFLTGLG